MGEDKLLEVDPEHIGDVLQALKQDWPSSIHIYYLIWMSLEWQDNNPHLKNIRVYRFGPPNEELFLAVVDYQIGDKLFQRVMIHSFMTDIEKIKLLILGVNAINWSANPTFEAVIEKDIPVIEEVCKIKNKSVFTDGLFYNVWLPTEKQEKITVSVPPDMYIGELTEEHAARVNDTWRYKFPGSDIIVRDSIVANYGLGLFRKSDNKLVAWNTVQHFAGLGMLYTEDDERGKGYGTLVTLALAKYLVDIDVDPHACIRVNNKPSMAVYSKLGFEVVCKVTWIMTSKISDSLSNLPQSEIT